jgi:hypothetical protein
MRFVVLNSIALIAHVAEELLVLFAHGNANRSLETADDFIEI